MWKRLWLVGAAVLLLVAAAGCSASPSAPSGPKTGAATSWELAIVRSGDLYLVTKPGGAEVRLTKGLSASMPLFSPDGRYIAFMDGSASTPASQHRLGIVGTDGKGLQLLKMGNAVLPGDFAWNPGQDILAVWGQELAMVRPGGSLQGRGAAQGQIGSFAWAPDGQGYAYTMMPPLQDFPNGSDTLYVVQGNSPPSKLLTAPTASGIEIQGYWPSGQGLLYWIDPLHSASLAADGLTLESLRLSGGSPQTLATTLPYPSWVEPAGQESVILVAGSGREAWTGKELLRCEVASGSCTSVQTQAGELAVDPAGTIDGTIAWVSATDFSPTSGGLPTQAALNQWNRSRTLFVLSVSEGTSHPTRVASGDVFAPELSPSGKTLLYVQQDAIYLWQAGHGAQLLAHLSAGTATVYHGYASYNEIFAWYPGTRSGH